MKALIKDVVKGFGYDIKPINALEDASFAPDATDIEKDIYKKVEPFTMTGLNAVLSLVQAVKYIVDNKITGDFVECGVWRGGSMMAAALMLQHLGDTTRRLYLYDTFSGMVAPTAKDQQFDGKSASQVWRENGDGAWCDAGLEDVQNNINRTAYPSDKVYFVEGKIEDTVPNTIPEQISLLRLDTDWYESTKHELEHLYPRLAPHGILIIDDYGHWEGARIAADEFFAEQKFKPFLHRIDYTRRLIIKPAGE